MSDDHVDEFFGTFTGPFPLDWEEGDSVGLDDVMTFIVTGVVKSDKRKVTKDGEVIKTHTFGVHESIPIPMGKVTALKAAIATDGDVLNLFQEQETMGFDVSDEDLSFDEDDGGLTV